jgi:hypothetical protein
MNTIRIHVIPTPPAPMGHPIAPPGFRFGLAPAANDDHANLQSPPRRPGRTPLRRASSAALVAAVTAAVALVAAAVLIASAIGP